MKILLTGASSFTGYWFARALAEAGHQVTAALRGAIPDYTNAPRATRVAQLARYATLVEHCSFGSPQFIALCKEHHFDLLCHHAARVGDYKNPNFDIAGAIAENILNLRDILAAGHFRAVLLTGTVFEADEGAGGTPLVAFSPYGISKGATAQVVRYRCHEAGIGFHKFVIPNPFGPLEEPRFCHYLMQQWRNGEIALVKTPDYVRDNIHVDLLAAAYATYAGRILNGDAPAKLNPSGYVESQGAFARRFAHEIRARSSLECRLELAVQSEFSEPLARINTDPATRYSPAWDEAAAWDSYAAYYLSP